MGPAPAPAAATAAGPARPPAAKREPAPPRQRWEGPAALTLGAAYLLTRLWGLVAIPLYYDEPIILHWGQVVGRETFVSVGGLPPNFISVWGGKEPLLAWFSGLCQGLLAMADPAVVGRMPALLAGAAALAALVVAGRWLFSPPVAYLGGLFYLLSPYALLFNVQLQPDSLLTGEVALMLLATLAILRGGGWLSLAGLALAFASAMLTKSSALLYLLGLGPVLLLARPPAGGLAGIRRPATALLLAVGAGYLVYYLVFGRTPYAASVADYNRIYLLSIADLLFLPVDRWLANARFLVENALDLLGVLPALLGAGSLAWAWHRGQAARALALWILVPVILHLVVATQLFARYFAPALPWLALLSAAALVAGAGSLRRFWSLRAGQQRRSLSNVVAGSAVALLLVQPAVGSMRLLADARWTIERGYTHDFGAVLEELRQELRRQAAQGPVVLLIYRGQGPLEDGSWVFLEREPGVRPLYLVPRGDNQSNSGPGAQGAVELVAYDPTTGEGVPARLLRGDRAYFVGGDGRNPPPGTAGHVEPVVTFTGLAGTHPLTLFRPTWDAAYWDGDGLAVR